MISAVTPTLNLRFCNFYRLLLCLSLMVCVSDALAQLANEPDDVALNLQQQQRLDVLAQLKEITEANQKRETVRATLQQALNGAVDEAEKLQLQEQLKQIDAVQEELQREFEQLVVGDLSVEQGELDDAPFDWREELLTVLRPLIEALKDLTEKPRLIEELRESIEQSDASREVAQGAIESIAELLTTADDFGTVTQLTLLDEKWKELLKDNQRRKDIAQVRLARLKTENGSWWSGFGEQARDFFFGRGLTLITMILVSIAAWLFMRFLWWLYNTKIISRERRRRSTRHRLLAYSYHVLTVFTVIVAALLVLYVRNDLVLLALAFVVLAGLILSLRNMISNYVYEARLLLDLGPVREGERVMYQGLPWQVMSLNVLTILRNPELEGVVRLPLQSLQPLSSREFKDDLWFPSSVDDAVFLPDGSFAIVLKQTPEVVSVRVRGGMITQYPTASFYNLAITNISRGETFGVWTSFGIDYKHIAVSLTEVPSTLEQRLTQAFDENDLSSTLQSLLVELSSAGASSLDYIIWATFSSESASSYYKIQRLMQQTCVAVCNEKQWDIPFPQMSVHLASQEPANL